MPTPELLPPDRGPGHEITAWRGRPFLWSLAGFAGFMLLMFTVLGALTRSWTHSFSPNPRQPSPPQARAEWDRDVPQLQVNPRLDIQELRRREQETLHRVAWATNAPGVAVIPIDRAMALLVAADARHQLNSLLPPPQPATPLDLQVQKSGEAKPNRLP
jgi:hypothetical protein